MNKVLLVCSSITYAQRISNILTQKGLFAGIGRTPNAIRIKACSYSVTIYAKDYLYIKSILDGKNIPILQSYLYENGNYLPYGGENYL